MAKYKLPEDRTPLEHVRHRFKLLDDEYKRDQQAIHKEISNFVAVGRGRYIDDGRATYQKPIGVEKMPNPSPARALGVMGAGLHGGLSSPSRPWFQLQLQDPGMQSFNIFRNYMDDVETALYSILKNSNFYKVIHNLYEETGGFGQGCLIVEDDDDKVVRFAYLTNGDFRFAVTPGGLVHTMAREIKMQRFQIAETFGLKNCSVNFKNSFQKDPYQWDSVYHLIEPNYNRDPAKIDNRNMAFRSIYCEKNTGDDLETYLSYGGYQEMPAVIPRWHSLSNEAYGWGPGLLALGISKGLQVYELNALDLTDKANNPPMGIPPSMLNEALDLSAGAKNVDTSKDGKGVRPLFEVNLAALDRLEAKIKTMEYRIQQIFFNDLFLLIASEEAGKMTATEVLSRNEEKMLMLGPVIENQLHEGLDPILTRVLNIAMRAGAVPPPPPELQTANYKIEYISVLAQAQKLMMSQGMLSYLAVNERIFPIDPLSMYKTDWDEYLDQYGSMVGMQSKVLRDKRQVQKMRDAAAQQAAQAAQQQQVAQGAAVMKDLGQASTEEGTAAGDIGKALSEQ
jgi:hypothetical protein